MFYRDGLNAHRPQAAPPVTSPFSGDSENSKSSDQKNKVMRHLIRIAIPNGSLHARPWPLGPLPRRWTDPFPSAGPLQVDPPVENSSPQRSGLITLIFVREALRAYTL